MERSLDIAPFGAAKVPHNAVLQQNWTSGGLLDRSECERLLVTSLPLVGQLSRFFCRGSRMTAEDIEDFIAQVRLHLIEDDYAVLRRFEGRCSFPTYLAMTIQHLLFDYRAKLWGRFRPSFAAKRAGPAAVKLETLVVRDGMSPAEAAAQLTAEGDTMTAAEAERLAAEFPKRKQRAMEVDLDDFDPALAVDSNAVDENLAARDRDAVSRTVRDVMREAMSDLPAEDRTILRLYFDAGMSIADIARSLGIEQRPLYRRIPRICDVLRTRLTEAGVAPADVTDLLGRADTDFDFGLREVRNGEQEPSTGTRNG